MKTLSCRNIRAELEECQITRSKMVDPDAAWLLALCNVDSKYRNIGAMKTCSDAAICDFLAVHHSVRKSAWLSGKTGSGAEECGIACH
jgi:hypothetical protein